MPILRPSFSPPGTTALLFALLLAMLCGWPPPARALDNGVPLAALHHDMWTAKEGAPREINAMAQTTDGWLWLGTTSGIYRFDGVRFAPVAPPPGEHFLGTVVTALSARPNGELWIGYTTGGMSVLHDGHLHHVAPLQGEPVGVTYAIAFDSDGSVWVASGKKGLLRYRDGQWMRMGAERGFAAPTARYVYCDHYGRVWAADNRDVFLLDRATLRFTRVRKIVNDALVLSSPDGRVWVSDGATVQLLPAPEGGWRPLPRAAAHTSSYQSLFDRDGNFWVGNCPVGLCRNYPSRWQKQGRQFADRTGDERLDTPGQMSSVKIHSMLEDREGNVWVGTIDGLDRFRNDALVRVPLLPSAEQVSLAADGTGTVWAASERLDRDTQLWRMRGGRAVLQPLDQDCYFVAPGKAGTVLVGGSRRIERRLGDRVLATYRLPREPGRRQHGRVSLAVDDGDDLWVMSSIRGLYRLHAGAWTIEGEASRLHGARTLAVDGQGRLWAGLRNNGLVVREDGRWREYGPRDGIAVGSVERIDTSDGIVAAGHNGLAVLRNGRFRMLVPEHGEALPAISGFAVTPDGNRWLNTPAGLLRVVRADWERSVRDPAVPLRTALWDTLDGYPGGAEMHSRQSSVLAAADGKLWIAGSEGPAWFDPARLRRNPVAPAVHVQSITADGRSHPAGAALAFAPGIEHVQIDYTALSYAVPERVRFRYRLVGADRDWQDVGARRVAYYTNLAPGSYRFEVVATNEDGVESPVACAAPFTIEPRYFQTGWFKAMCLLAGMLAAYLLYLLRLRQATRRIRAQLEARTSERERIARTLHDTFLQSLQALILRLDALATRAPADSDLRDQLERVVHLAGQVVEEGRSQVLDLRAAGPLRALDDALADAAGALRSDDAATVALAVRGTAHTLASDLQQEVFLIAREALANALRHAGARRIDVLIDWTRTGMTLTVRDDGHGLPADVLAHDRPGHYGLSGMRERARRIGATLALRNRRDGASGAEVVLTLALRAPRRGGWGQTLRWWRDGARAG